MFLETSQGHYSQRGFMLRLTKDDFKQSELICNYENHFMLKFGNLYRAENKK